MRSSQAPRLARALAALLPVVEVDLVVGLRNLVNPRGTSAARSTTRSTGPLLASMLRALGAARSPSTADSVPARDAGLPNVVKDAPPDPFRCVGCAEGDRPPGSVSGGAAIMAAIPGCACPRIRSPASRTHRSVAPRKEWVSRPGKAFSQAILGVLGRIATSTTRQSASVASTSVQPAAPAPCARARRGMRGMALSSKPGNADAPCCAHPHRLHRFIR